MSIYSAFRHRVWAWCHKRRCKGYRKRYDNFDVSIISMNCTGGILYHDLGLPFLSPTINLYMRAEDFIKFCENMEHYFMIDKFVEITDPDIVQGRKYPIARLGDILLFLVHYKSVSEAETKWNKRKKRINWNKIVILNNDREGMTPELMDRFERLPYKKIMFTHRPHPKRSEAIHYLPGYENEDCIGIITDGYGYTGLRPIDQFDWVWFLNKI